MSKTKVIAVALAVVGATACGRGDESKPSDATTTSGTVTRGDRSGAEQAPMTSASESVSGTPAGADAARELGPMDTVGPGPALTTERRIGEGRTIGASDFAATDKTMEGATDAPHADAKAEPPKRERR